MYTEEQLLEMDRQGLIDICTDIAKRYSRPLEDIVPRGTKKDILIETILESQEEKGGS